MVRVLKNSKMAQMLQQLQPFLERSDKIGYAAARNYRRLSDCLVEYERFRNALIEKYGEHEKDGNGNDLPAVSISVNSPNFKMFADELAPLNEIEHSVDLMLLPYGMAIHTLSGAELLEIDWMFTDDETEVTSIG